MRYEDGQTVMLGDIVKVDLHDGDHTGRIVMIGETGEYSGLDEKTAKWALECGHVGKDNVMLQWIEPNPLAHDDPKYAPVSNTLSTCLCGMVLVRRENGSQRGAAEGHVGRLNKDGISMIRHSTDSDRVGINGIHMSAFGQAQGQEIIELVNGLLGDKTAKPLLSLVAEINEKIVGHILFTRAILQLGHQDVSVRILAPLAVSRELQGKGIGASLIIEGLNQLTKSGVDLVFVLGHPDYYPKYGFRPAGVLGFEPPYPIPAVHADAWMVQELQPGVIGSVQGTIQCAKVLDEPRHWRE